jgi:hypothetical protein
MNHAFSTGLFDKRSEEAMKKTTARIEAFDFNVTRIWTENRKTFVTLIPDCNHGEVTLRADYILEGRYSGLCKECSYKNRNRKENV